MSFAEKSAWVLGGIALVFPAIYLLLMAGELQRTPVPDIAFQVPLVGSIVAALVTAFIAHIVIVGTTPDQPAGIEDERDRTITIRGEYVTGVTLGMAMLAVLGLVLFELDHFWIATAMYVAMALSGLAGCIARIVAYRRGLPTW